MKRNKIAAGALALALGFGAVAPVHADEDNPSPESVKELINAMRNERENLDSNSKKIMDALGKAQEIERERQRAAQGDGTTVEDNNNTGNTTSDKGDTTTPDKGDKTPDKGDTTPDKGDTTPDKGDTTPDKGDTTPDKGDTTPDKGDTTPDKGDTTPDKGDTTPDKGKNEEIKKGPYDTQEEATEAAKKALKAAPTMNEYVVYKDAEGKFYFYIRNNSTDGKGKAEEEGNEVVATGKKDDSKESSSPARQADDNAKTGVTGLVSVASILGAASVAYVASKKRD